jgi:HSP20 family protein
MSIVRWEPFQEMDDLVRRFSSLMGRAALRQQHGQAFNDWAPIANISETDKEYLIKAELPEVKKEDVKVMLDNGVITISGERKQQKEQKDENEIRVESFYGTFSRSFALPDNVDANGIKAESKDGVLRISIPKTGGTQHKAIAINLK